MFPYISKSSQRAFELSQEAEAANVPMICGYRGRACRQMCKAEGANRSLCSGCPLAEFASKFPAVTPGTIYAAAVEVLPAKDIDHHATDLYLRITPDSKALIARLDNKVLLSRFHDQIDGDMWYELPFCYLPAYATHE